MLNPSDAIHRTEKLLWTAIYAAILIGGVILSATGYRHALPFIELGDEMTIWTFGRSYIDPEWKSTTPNYPPGLPLVSAAVQKIQIAAGDAYYNPAGTVEIMRLMAVAANLGTLIIVMLLAWRFAGASAGAAAGLFWMLLPLANIHATLSTANAWLSLWLIASVATGIEGWRRQSQRWILVSFVFGMLGTLFKWQAVAGLGVSGLALLSFWNTNRRRAIILIAVYVIVVGAFGFWAIFIHRALDGDAYLPGVKSSFPTLTMLLINFEYQLGRAGPFLIFGLLPVLALILSVATPALRDDLHRKKALWILPIVLIVYVIIVSFSGVAPVFDRHYLAAMTVQAVLAGVGVALLPKVITDRFASGKGIGTGSKMLGRVALVGLLIVLLTPLAEMFNASRAHVLEMLRPDRWSTFAEWARTTATDGPLLITESTLGTAVQTLFGYRGRKIDTPYNDGILPLIKEDAITREVITAKNIRYLVTSPGYTGEQVGLPLTRLITLGADGVFRGPEWTAWYVGALPSQFPPEAVVTFGGEVQLRGYELSKTQLCPGEAFDLQLLWGAATRPTRYYAVYLHLFSEKTGEISAPDNGHQPVNEDRPTITWTRPDELLIGARRTLTLPDTLPPGEYQLWLGVFEPVSNVRLTLPDGKDRHVLTTVQVGACPANK